MSYIWEYKKITQTAMKKLLLNVFAVFALLLMTQLSATAQGTYNICSISTTQDSIGTLYDTGGPNDVYQVNENCTLLISPPCATSITLTFQKFATESGFDFFTVYDGTTTAGLQLMNTAGTTIPAPVTATSGNMLIIWRSDVSIVDSGFACTWSSVIAPSMTPTAAIGMSNVNPPLLTDVQFTDLSAGGPVRWLWDFGDGDTAKSQNPIHAYSAPGTYTVTLTAYSCVDSNVTTSSITVQAAPQISVSPDSLVANVMCGDVVTFNLDVSNVGGGQLVYSTDGSTNSSVRVLAMSYGTDLFAEFPRTIAAINQFFTNYTLTTTATTNAGTLQGLLVGKNVLLIPEQELGDPAVWTTLGPVIRQFLNNGGSVVWCGSFSSNADCMFNTGVFSGNYIENATGNNVTVINAAHPLAAGLTPTFTAPSATFSYNITNVDKDAIATDPNGDIITTRQYGSGKAIFLAFDYYTSAVNSSQAIANAISWGGQNGLASWISLSVNSDTVTAVGTSSVVVTFQTTGLAAGTYISNIAIASNDPVNPTVLVPCTLTVAGDPAIALSDTACLDFGTIMQHTSATATFDILNEGCDSLIINSLSSTGVQFTATSVDNFVLPGGFMTVTATFNSSTVGTFNEYIQISNNDIDTVICVTGTTFAAPAIVTNPTSVSKALQACGASTTATFTIDNTGGTDLTFNLGSSPTWLSASPTSGTVAPAGSTTITLTFNSGTLVGGNYNTNLTITSNDPLNLTKTVPCTLTVAENPCVDFTYVPNTCTGEFVFTSTSINTPTSYSWDFGDGTGTSSDPNPSYHYSANGTVTITLIASNAAGSDTVVMSNVPVVITGPKPTSCYPVTTAYCCGIGITNVRIGNHPTLSIDNTTFDAIEGYQDYACTEFMDLYKLDTYSISVSTGFTYTELVKAWIDWNNDGALDPVTELIFADSALTFHLGNFTIPSSAVEGQPLRLRLASDFSGNPTPEPCLDLSFGQVEDYAVFVRAGTRVATTPAAVDFNVYPNPFTNNTTIEYSLNNSSVVSLEVFNLIGEKVKVFSLDEKQVAGNHNYTFNDAETGIYFVKLSIDGTSVVQKIIKM